MCLELNEVSKRNVGGVFGIKRSAAANKTELKIRRLVLSDGTRSGAKAGSKVPSERIKRARQRSKPRTDRNLAKFCIHLSIKKKRKTNVQKIHRTASDRFLATCRFRCLASTFANRRENGRKVFVNDATEKRREREREKILANLEKN